MKGIKEDFLVNHSHFPPPLIQVMQILSHVNVIIILAFPGSRSSHAVFVYVLTVRQILYVVKSVRIRSLVCFAVTGL